MTYHATLFAVPASAALLAAIGARVAPVRMRPGIATRVTTALVVLSAAAGLWSLMLVGFAAVIEIHGIAERLSWCSGFTPMHTDRLNPIGAFALGLIAASILNAARAVRRHHRLHAPDSNGGLAVVPGTKPAAYALPGRPGKIVVSRGMLQLLDGDERRALLAHERAHLDLRHHRYLRAAETAAALLVPLHPLVARVRLSTERWADEEAARAVGDRRLVARTVARAALAQSTQPTTTRWGVLGVSDTAALVRVEALLSPAPERRRAIEISFVALVAAVAIALVVSADQAHHVFAYAVGLCWF